MFPLSSAGKDTFGEGARYVVSLGAAYKVLYFPAEVRLRRCLLW